MRRVGYIKFKNFISFFIIAFLIPSVFSEDIETPTTTIPGATIGYSMPGSLNVYINENSTFTVKVSNTGTIALHNITMLMSGIPPQSFSIDSTQISILEPGNHVFFSVSIYTQNLSSQAYTLEITFRSDETSEVTSLPLNVKQLPKEVEETIQKQKEFEQIKSRLTSIIYLFIGIIVASVVIIIVMLILFKAKRCPLCGSKIEKEYEGKNYVSYKCTKCKYYSLKIKKTT